MQRGVSTRSNVTTLPSNQFIYTMVCQELNKTICRREQNRVALKRCNGRNQEGILNLLNRLEIEFNILNKLKAQIENPDYYDEVYDGIN